MDISKMSDQEKSVLLVKAVGWYVRNIPLNTTNDAFKRVVVDSEGIDVGLTALGGGTKKRDVPLKLNLYEVDRYGNPVHMPLVWKCLNWASKRVDNIDDYSYPYYFAQGVEWLFDTTEEIEDQIWAKPPEEALRIMLDTVLELCFQAGKLLRIKPKPPAEEQDQ